MKDFGDSKEASQARAKLAALGGAPGFGRLTTERVSDLDWSYFTLAVDRPLYALTDWETGDLMLRDLVTGETRDLTNNGPGQKAKEFAQTSVISTDGKMVVYTWSGGRTGGPNSDLWTEIRSINSDGTGVRTHLRRATRKEYLSPVALSPDKLTVIVMLGLSGGSPAQVEALSMTDNSLKPFGDGLRISEASFSPDGKQVVFSGDKGAKGDTGSDLFLANADGSGVRPLLTESGDDNSPFWTPDGKWVVFLSDRTGSRAIWAISSAGGAPRLLKQDDGIGGLHGLTRDGSLYYSTFVSQADVHVAQLDPETLAVKGEPGRFIGTFLGRNSGPSFSPDGKWIAWRSTRGPRGERSIVVRPTAGGEEKVMPMLSALEWLPDSRALLVRRSENGQRIFERVEVPDGRTTELYRGAPPGFSSSIMAREGSVLLVLRCGTRVAPKPCDLVRYDLQTKSETVETLDETFNGVGASMEVSPDGKWLAMMGSGGLFVKPMAGGKLVELARRTDTVTFQEFVWTPDGKQIVYGVRAPSRGIWVSAQPPPELAFLRGRECRGPANPRPAPSGRHGLNGSVLDRRPDQARDLQERLTERGC